MILPHRYLPGAQTDLFESVQYYESREVGLGGRFLDEIEVALAEICEHPNRYPAENRRVRKHTTRHFPYGIYYTVAQEKVFILAIGDLRRKPRWWKSRLTDLR